MVSMEDVMMTESESSVKDQNAKNMRGTAEPELNVDMKSAKDNVSFGPAILHRKLAYSPLGRALAKKGFTLKTSNTVPRGRLIFPRAKVTFMLMTFDLNSAKDKVTSTTTTTTAATSDGFQRPTASQSLWMDPAGDVLPGISASDWTLHSCSNSSSSNSRCISDNENSSTPKAPRPGALEELDAFMHRHDHRYVILLSPLFTSLEFKVINSLQISYMATNVDFLLAHNAEECVQALLSILVLQYPGLAEVQHNRFRHVMQRLLQEKHNKAA